MMTDTTHYAGHVGNTRLRVRPRPTSVIVDAVPPETASKLSESVQQLIGYCSSTSPGWVKG